MTHPARLVAAGEVTAKGRRLLRGHRLATIASNPRRSPDSLWLTFGADGDVHIAAADGSATPIDPTDDGLADPSSDWSP